MAAKVIFVPEEADSFVMVLVAGHDEQRALLDFLWHKRLLLAIWSHLRPRLLLVCVQLSTKKTLSQDLEERFLRRQSDVELAFRAIEAKAATLTTGKDNHTNFSLTYELVSSSEEY